MKAQFPRALHREKECAGHGARMEKTCGRHACAGERRFAAPPAIAAPPGGGSRSCPEAIRVAKRTARRDPADRSSDRLPNDLGELVRSPLRKMKMM